MALEKLLKDIKDEKNLWTLESTDNSAEAQEAWACIGHKNNLTALEARTTFKILLKRYKQEAQKPKSSWRLFDHFKSLQNEDTKKPVVEVVMQQPPPPPQEEETYVELLEVKDEDFSDEDSGLKENAATNFKPVPIKTEPDATNKGECSSTTPESRNNTLPTTPSLKRKLPDTNPNEGVEVQSEKRQAREDNSPSEIIKNIQNTIHSKAETEYTSFGTYVASTLNKLPQNKAAKLEVRLLQAIIDVKSDMLE